MQIMDLAAFVCGLAAVPAIYMVSACLRAAGRGGNTISKQQYKAAVALRADRCRPVDEIVKGLQESGITPEFHL